MIMTYPWLSPGPGTLFPRDSHRLWYMWAGMGVASLAVMLYRGLGAVAQEVEATIEAIMAEAAHWRTGLFF